MKLENQADDLLSAVGGGDEVGGGRGDLVAGQDHRRDQTYAGTGIKRDASFEIEAERSCLDLDVLGPSGKHLGVATQTFHDGPLRGRGGSVGCRRWRDG